MRIYLAGKVTSILVTTVAFNHSKIMKFQAMVCVLIIVLMYTKGYELFNKVL